MTEHRDDIAMLGPLYLAFTADTPQDAAVQRFVERYGRAPQELLPSLGIVLVGPIEEATCTPSLSSPESVS